MIGKVKAKLQIKSTKVLVSNVISLFILKGSDYILPLILLPYLVRVLGIEYFGLLAFATATVSFFRGIVTYGFDLSGTQQIAVNKDNQKKIIEIFSSILIVKFILALITFIIFMFLLFFIDKFCMHWEVYLFTFLIVFGDVLFPIWYFQGIEKMRMITYLRISYKFIFVLSILLLVNEADDFMLVPLFDSIGAILTGIISLYIINKKYNISFVLPIYSEIVFQFKNGWHIFLSQISVIMYTSINTFLLGILTTNEIVGFYSLAHKVYLALRGLLSPIIQALFPYLSKEYNNNKNSYYKKARKLSIIFAIILLNISIFTYIFSSNIIHLISGKTIIESVDVLKILLFSLPFAIGSFYSALLVIKSESKTLLKVTSISMIINLILVYPSIYFYGIYGLAWQFVVVQVIQAILQIKYNFEIWRN